MSQSLPLTGTMSVGLEGGQKMGFSSCGLLSWWCSGSGFLSVPEGFNDTHCATATRAWFTQGHRFFEVIFWLVWFARGRRSEQGADPGDFFFATCPGQEAVVADTVETVWQHIVRISLPVFGIARFFVAAR